MKRSKIILSLVLVVLVIAIVFIFFRKDEPTVSSSTELQMIKIEQNSLNIMVDPRIELLSAIQLYSDYTILTRLDFKYKKDMQGYFSKYKRHSSVQLFKSMSYGGFSYDAPPATMLYYSNPPVLEAQRELDNELKLRGGGEASINNFIRSMNSYCMDSGFVEFYNMNSEFYKDMVNAAANNIKEYDLVKDLEDYYGNKQNSYNLILAPLFHGGGYGPRVKTDGGNYDIYGIIGPHDVKDGIPQYNKEAIRYIAWHEFGHSFVNPATSKYINEINKYSMLYDPISIKMTEQAYTQWEICVNEHIIRAVVARLSLEKFGEKEYHRIIDDEKAQGFFYIEAICKELEQYENNRDKYKTFEEFYPEIVNMFKVLSESNLDKDFYKVVFNGPISNAFSMENPIVFITPTAEESKVIQEKINSYVKKIKENIDVLQNAEIITDVDALRRDLGKNTILAYGTMEGNLWLAKYKDVFPFKINKDRITMDKEYMAKERRFMSALPNPMNPDNALIIYTAQEAKDIEGINNVFHGPTDYILLEGENQIASGDYIKENGKWSFK